MMKRAIILALALSMLGATGAPAAASSPEMVGGVGFLTIGSSPLDLTHLDESLEAKGLPASRDTFSFGAGGYGFLDRLVLGGEAYGMIGRTVSNDTYTSRVDAGMGLVKVGYVVYSNEHFRVYPMAGIGGGGVNVRLQKRTSPSFDDVLSDPGQESTLSAFHLLLDLGVGADYLIKIGKSKGGEGNLAVGLRAGYTFSPVQSEWRMSERIIPDGPEVAFTGPYIRLVVGAGGSRPFPVIPADEQH